MKNMTPVILVMLLLTSFLAGMDMHELEEQVVIEETGARSGADATVIAITSPKETTCNDQGCRNTLQVGEETTFSAFIKNDGMRTSPSCRTRSPSTSPTRAVLWAVWPKTRPETT